MELNDGLAAQAQQAGTVPDVHSGPIVVGIGGSAGALSALMGLLEALGDVPLAVVVVLHLSPDHESNAAEILQRVTPLSVVQVRSRTVLKAGHVYVIAPGMNLITEDGHVQPAEGQPKRPSAVIDLFFRSLGKVHRDHAVAIVLSGTGRDGALGLSHVKECGGLTIAQAAEDCEHADMPRAACATGAVDLVLSTLEIGKRLIELSKFPRSSLSAVQAGVSFGKGEDSAEDASAERAFQDILTALRVRTRHDFRHYKRGTLVRRLERRMQVNGLSSIQAYRDYVRNKPEELAPLLADMLISVTNFFRDPRAFEALQRDVVPELMKSVAAGEELRVWTPACASGEESYSIAILVQEYADQMSQPPRVQVFASDINEAALNFARAGIYPLNIAADITDSRLLSYFEKGDGEHYRVRSGVREMIVFARHNVLGDPPFSRLNLVCCRNLLIYLDRTAQAAVLEMFAYALKPGGYLFLGNAESIDVASTAFETINKEHRIYRLRPDAATARTRIPSQLLNLGPPPALAPPVQGPRVLHATQHQPLATLHESALVTASPPSVLINADHDIERVSPGAGRFVAFAEGLPTRNLLNNVAPDIRVELRTALFRAAESLQPVHSVFRRSDAQGPNNGAVMVLSIHPVKAADADPVHWLVLFFEPIESSIRLPEPGEADDTGYPSAMRRLEDENRSLKAHLQDTLDRSAISTEELRASNEELQAINEELRSAKEELETSKEELQSVNEELTTVNFELRMKVDEAGRNNDDLRNLIEASEIATVFVDPGMCVKRFTPQASKLFALIPSDVGRPLMDITSRLQYDGLVDDATTVFKQLVPVERSVTSTDNEHFFARILPYRTGQDKIGGAVLTFINVTELRRAEDRVRLTEERLRDAIAASKDFAVMCTDTEGRITTWNEGATRTFGYQPPDILGQSIDVLFTADDRALHAPEQERSTAVRDGRASDERWHVRKDGTTFFCSGVMTPLHSSGHMGFIKIARDTTDRKDREVQQQRQLSSELRTNAEMKSGSELKDRFLAVMSHELKQPLNLIQVNAQLLVRLPETRESSLVQRIGGTIMRAVAAQETIVNDLLDLSRIQTGKMRLQCEATDVAAIVRQLCQAMAPDIAGKKIAFDVQASQQVTCYCDPVRIEQIVWNLLGNAVKFTPEHGRISIRVFREESTARLEVADDGLGISADALPNIFNLFSQAGEAIGTRRAGLGIGLALVRELVQEQGGHVEATSAGPGQGAVFTVWMPLAMQTPTSTASATLSMSLQQRILIVDDDIDSLTSFAALLELEGASVSTTTRASEALSMLAEGNYDLLLSDIGMPEMSGLELMKRARELQPAKHFRSVAISGYGSESDARDARAAGFDAHVSKPISIERLRAALESL
jgi:two-component system, chemotaxis family, CheB/CheR fusion protein